MHMYICISKVKVVKKQQSVILVPLGCGGQGHEGGTTEMVGEPSYVEYHIQMFLSKS